MRTTRHHGRRVHMRSPGQHTGGLLPRRGTPRVGSNRTMRGRRR